MKKAVWLQETKVMRFEDALSGWTEKRLMQEAAAALLGVCPRSFRRYVDRYHEDGIDRLVDRRLPKELAAEGVLDMEMANQYLEVVFWPSWNKRFAVPAAQSGNGFVPLLSTDLDDILCLKEERKVGNDNCVRYKNLSLQIPPGPHCRHYVRRKVRVHEHSDGRLSVFHGPWRLGRYQADGSPAAAA